MHEIFGFGSTWPMVGMLVFWILLIVIGFYLVANFVNGGQTKQTKEDLLKERLARGDIDKEKYEELLKIIKK
ncbi:SHOCT domain-containing protein [Ornithinibacillus sp. L9]|uniref:SHOCT domain-containing protein n=1 Tax=Ornithinibacillus caprae TaxID=2678566 RepID=A0A6N8FHR6_9BACI|nr:SHOCT domain-containing protein [Ornithinibacillus caprae]MUK89212.1 SHOCT domain-containing protein [Ornithinibacillus caprae]